MRGFKLTTGVSARLKTDVVFMIDNTQSMASGISSVRSNVLAFVTVLRNSEQDVRVGVVAFNDNGANDGGDNPELAFSAIDYVRTSFDWQNGAQKISMAITEPANTICARCRQQPAARSPGTQVVRSI